MNTALASFLRGADLVDGAPSITTKANRVDLCRLLADLGYRRGAEIGTWAGEFAESICHANPGVHLTCVDPWLQYKHYNEKKNNQARLDVAYDEARARLAPFGCTLMRLSSAKAADLIQDGSLDFVYIDANHAEDHVRQDLEAWAPKVRSGGVVSGHDYCPNPKATKAHLIGVKPAVDGYTHAHGIAPWYVLAAEKAPSFFWVAT